MRFFAMRTAAARLPRPVSLGDLPPVEVAARLSHLPGLVFFDSATEAGSLSIVAARPETMLSGTLDGDWPVLTGALRERMAPDAVDDGLPHGFAAGYAGYDGGFTFGFYDQALFFCHAKSEWREIGSLSRELQEPALPRTEPLFFNLISPGPNIAAWWNGRRSTSRPGDIYQVNLAHRFSAPWSGDPLALYRELRDCSPAPHAAYLRFGETAVLSASPELFLQMSGRQIRTRPIKGTRPRRREGHADEKSAYDLITSAKEVAELVMITDLERSDLGQVCEWGSVVVPELLTLERFAQVFHLVSTVEGRLRPEVDQASAWRACFPGGSITGAPKKRAREIIAELEPEGRGLYTGALGWFGYNGESRFSIAIRTIVAEPGRAHFQVGAGIVADSVAEREWQETLDKADGMLLAAERYNASLSRGITPRG